METTWSFIKSRVDGNSLPIRTLIRPGRATRNRFSSLGLVDWEVGKGLWTGYEAGCPVDEKYVQRRPIYQLFWCLEYADSSLKHLADTQGVCKQPGIPSLVHFE